jgi:cysteinyl-tRNA synthetase
LGSLPPTFEPRATDFVLPRADGKADMVTLIKQLIERGHAYQAAGEVLFDTASMPDYGALSGRKLDEQRPGARVAVDAHKKNPGDFVLWKQSSGNEPGWESPWGRGRPGWHIECSAMATAYLGDVFDIHGGGLDLIFPHHENEIAQSRCAHGTSTMANYWMHNEFVQLEDTKMSKSLGNFVTIRELLADWPGEVLRLNMLKAHYRSPMDWTLKGLEESHKILWNWYEGLASVEQLSNVSADVISALSDDLNTAQMISALHGLHRSDHKRELRAALGLLGFSGDRNKIGRTAQAVLTAGGTSTVRFTGASIVKADIDKLVADRTAARARKDFKESDRIRDELAAMGVVIKDSKDGTTWEVAR